MAETVSTGLRAWTTLALLSALYVLSFVDRLLLAMMIGPIKADLGLTDIQAGMLFGTYFALFYGMSGVPLARVADRGHRKAVIVSGVIVWSAATFASAFAQSYAMLAFLRMGLAAGEAALVAPALAVVSQIFPPHRRILACTLLSAAGMVGAALYSVFGAGVLELAAMLAGHFAMAPWRLGLALVSIPSFILAGLLLVVMKEPATTEAAEKTSNAACWQYLMANRRLYGGLFVAAAAVQALGYAMVGWLPTLLERNHDLAIGNAGLLIGAINVVAIVGGTLIMPGLVERTVLRHPRYGAWLPVVTSGVGVVCIAGGVLAPGLEACLLLVGFGLFLTTGTTNAVQVLMQIFVPPAFRATVTAVLMFSVTCIGLGIGPTFAAWAGGASGGGIGMGLALLAMPVLVIGVAAFALAAIPLAREIAAHARTRQQFSTTAA